MEASQNSRTLGPLQGLKIIEFAGIGPAPFGAMMLADAGAEVICIQREPVKSLSGHRDPASDPLLRGRQCLTLDLKRAGATAVALRLIATADALIEGFRPGVMERLGLGPEICLAANPKLVYGRMTGWGQTGPLAQAAGHDINYIALSGALHATGVAEHPVPPLNLVGDFGGGGMMLAFGLMAALWEAARSGRGQVVDAAMSDGAALLMAPFHEMFANGSWIDQRESNVIDGGAPYYGCYRCSDGGFVSIGPLEPQFYSRFLTLMEIDDPMFHDRANRALWPRLRAELTRRFRSRTRAQWCALLEGTDACFAPVLALAEVASHPHHIARQTFIDVGGRRQPAPSPRFSRTAAATPRPRLADKQITDSILGDAGFDAEEIDALHDAHLISGT